VPWTTQSNAWQWKDRARNFHWRVSSSPSPGAIVDLQPWVQGAYGLGHVAVVERILNNGHVIASNLNWGAYPEQVTYVEFVPDAGVSFITY
jgi:surface antigen